jgi:aromatic-L-amino-acid decarboxylase
MAGGAVRLLGPVPERPRRAGPHPGLRPTYLETAGREEIVNFNEWTVPLGRRFRALKLWFVLRAYGLEGLRERIRNHVAWALRGARQVAALPGVEIVTEPRLSLFTFALQDDAATEALLQRINDDGRIYLTQTAWTGGLPSGCRSDRLTVAKKMSC